MVERFQRRWKIYPLLQYFNGAVLLRIKLLHILELIIKEISGVIQQKGQILLRNSAESTWKTRVEEPARVRIVSYIGGVLLPQS